MRDEDEIWIDRVVFKEVSVLGICYYGYLTFDGVGWPAIVCLAVSFVGLIANPHFWWYVGIFLRSIRGKV